ncbi:MAG: TolC family protein, partial [Pseudomonadota bacterium]
MIQFFIRHVPYAFVALLAFAGLFTPQNASAQNMDTVLAEVYATNPDLLLDRAQLRETNEDIAQALSGFNPDVRITSNFGKRT